MTTNKIDLPAIQARHEAATKGEWQWRKSFQNAVHMHTPDMIEICQFVWGADGVPIPPQVEGNFIFIAHARTDIPALCKEVERGQAAYDNLECCIKGALETYSGMPSQVRHHLELGLSIARKALEQEK